MRAHTHTHTHTLAHTHAHLPTHALSAWLRAETVLGLLRNPDVCVYGSASVSSERSLGAGEDAFNRMSMEERGKFKEETLVNYGGRTRQGGAYAGGSSCAPPHCPLCSSLPTAQVALTLLELSYLGRLAL